MASLARIAWRRGRGLLPEDVEARAWSLRRRPRRGSASGSGGEGEELAGVDLAALDGGGWPAVQVDIPARVIQYVTMAGAVTPASTLRRDQASAVRARIVAAAIAVIEAGAEPTMRGVAHAAAISERTVYRYFASLEELQAAVVHQLRDRASAPMADDVDGLPDYVRRLFTTFDANAALTRALATARWAPTSVTRPANLRALRKILDAAFPRAPRADRESAAASLRVVYSATGWAYLADCGFGREASIRHAQWLTTAALTKLRQLSGGPHA